MSLKSLQAFVLASSECLGTWLIVNYGTFDVSESFYEIMACFFAKEFLAEASKYSHEINMIELFTVSTNYVIVLTVSRTVLEHRLNLNLLLLRRCDLCLCLR